jgi:MinD-like ATPase involved in chromosome partitioning or flagellar assembly
MDEVIINMAMNLIIADTDQEYMERLEQYLVKKTEGMYNIIKYTDKDELSDALKKKKYDILLCSPDLYDESITYKHVILSILLKDEDEVQHMPDVEIRVINKFTRITTLIDYIAKEYEEAKSNQPTICCVYSPAGGVGKTTVALSMAIAYAKMGKKAFYLNLEDFESTHFYFRPREGAGIGDVLSEFSTKRETEFKINEAKIQELRINEAKQVDIKTGVMYFSQFKDVNVLRTITEEQITALIERLTEGGISNAVFIDTSTGLSNINRCLFNLADKVIIVARDNATTMHKVNKFLMSEDIVGPIRSKLKLLMNRSSTVDNSTGIEVISRIDELSMDDPLEMCELIAQNYIINK